MIESTIFVGDLRAQKGARRNFHLAIPSESFSTPVVTFEDDLICDFTAENVSQGFVVHGNISAQYVSQCSYGLVDISSSLSVNVNELFEENPISQDDEEIYSFRGENIDLEQLLRDSILTSLPLAPVCDHGPENCSVCTSQIQPFISKEIPTEHIIGSIDDALGDNASRQTNPWSVLDELKLDEQE